VNQKKTLRKYINPKSILLKKLTSDIFSPAQTNENVIKEYCSSAKPKEKDVVKLKPANPACKWCFTPSSFSLNAPPESRMCQNYPDDVMNVEM
jgi:hypothetical protein